MKKKIALLLAGVMVIGMLAGCGGKSETPSSDTAAATTKDGEASAAAELAGTKVAWVTNQSDAWHHQTAVTTQEKLKEKLLLRKTSGQIPCMVEMTGFIVSTYVFQMIL